MTPNEFKIKYPQFAHLEGDELWNAMEDMFLSSTNVLHTDPNQEKAWLEPIEIEIPDKDGIVHKHSIIMEDDSTTRWLDKDGNLVRVGDIFPLISNNGNVLTSHSLVFLDLNNTQ